MSTFREFLTFTVRLRCMVRTFSKRKVHSSLFCFSLLVLHEEKGHVTHKESKKQGGKSSRKLRTYRTFSRRKRLLAICSFQVDLKLQLQRRNCNSLKTPSCDIESITKKMDASCITEDIANVEKLLQVSWDEHNCTFRACACVLRPCIEKYQVLSSFWSSQTSHRLVNSVNKDKVHKPANLCLLIF